MSKSAKVVLGRGLINAPFAVAPEVRFQGEADMNRHARLAGSVKNDPSQTSRSQ